MAAGGDVVSGIQIGVIALAGAKRALVVSCPCRALPVLSRQNLD